MSDEQRLREREIEARLAELSDAQRIDLKRRRDICSGVIHASASLFVARARVRNAIKAHEKKDTRRSALAFGTLIVGIVIDWFLRDEGKVFQFTAGTFIALAALLWGLGWWWRGEELRRQLITIERDLTPLLATFVGAGATASDFWGYGQLADVEAGEIDWTSREYRDWWRELQLMLLMAVGGHY
jgi:hypothetical protein